MSEPISSVEIEDVLSSIRRLVSEDLRPPLRTAQSGITAARAMPPGMNEAGRAALILTPALRVVPENDDASAQAAEPDPAAAQVGNGSDAPDQPDVEVTPAQPIAEPDLPPAVDALPGDVAAAAEDAPETPISAGWAQRLDEDAEAGAEPPDAFPGAQPQQVFADADWLDETEAEIIATLERTGHGPRQHRHSEPLDPPEMTFDEEVLRDLVRDLIREELQGQLGERITRNIRKLVRAEIARALAVAELE